MPRARKKRQPFPPTGEMPLTYEKIPWNSEWERDVARVIWRELGQIVRPEHFERVVKAIAASLP